MKSILKIQEISLALLSFFLITLFLFTLLEWMPGLVKTLKLDAIHYYSLKNRYLADPDLIFRNQPGFHYRGFFTGDIKGLSEKAVPKPYDAQFDDEGFRNAGQPGPTDIVTLGDSFLQFGLTEEDTLAKRLEKKTGQRVANFGTEWYGPVQYLESFKKFGLKRSPKIALFCFFEGNDLRDTAQYLLWEQGGNYYHFNLTGKNFIERYFIAMKDTVTFAVKRILKNWDPRKTRVELSSQSFETVFTYPIDLRPEDQILNSPEGLKLREVLKEFKGISASSGIVPLVVFIPSATHVYLPYTRETSHKDALQNRKNVENAVAKAVRELGIEWIDLTPVYNEATEGGVLLYYPFDTHWNENGRELAAETIAEKIKALKPA